MSDDRVVSIEKRENGLIATMQCKEMDFGASEALKEAVAKAIGTRRSSNANSAAKPIRAVSI